MDDKLIKEYAVKFSISETILRLMMKNAFEKAASICSKKKEIACFDYDNGVVYFIEKGFITEKKLKEFGKKYPSLVKQCFAHLLSQLRQGKDSEIQINANDDNRDLYRTYDDGPYCSSCQQTPCMCSDPEATSSTYEF